MRRRIRLRSVRTIGWGLVVDGSLGLALLALGVATSSLGFIWVLRHDQRENFFPEWGGIAVYLSDILVVAGLVAWGIGWLATSRRPLSLGPRYVFVPLLLLVALTILSVAWADHASLASFSALRRILLLGLYIVLVNEARRALYPMAVALFLVGLLQAGVAVAQVFEGSTVGLGFLGELEEGDFGYESVANPRAYALGFNANSVGLFLAIVSALGFGLALLWQGGWRTRLLVLVPCAGAFWGLCETASRSALLDWLLGILAVTLLAWLWRSQARTVVLRRIGLAALALIVAAALCDYLPLEGAASQASTLKRFEPTELSGSRKGRVEDWEKSFPIIRDNLVLGVGAGNYPSALREREYPDHPSPGVPPVHNVTLLMTAELGVVGGGLWFLLMVSPLVWLFLSFRRRNASSHVLLWLGPLVVPLFVSLLEFTPWATQDGRVLFMALLGLWAGAIGTGSRQVAGPESQRLSLLTPAQHFEHNIRSSQDPLAGNAKPS